MSGNPLVSHALDVVMINPSSGGVCRKKAPSFRQCRTVNILSSDVVTVNEEVGGSVEVSWTVRGRSGGAEGMTIGRVVWGLEFDRCEFKVSGWDEAREGHGSGWRARDGR